jgi:hypothetical protein
MLVSPAFVSAFVAAFWFWFWFWFTHFLFGFLPVASDLPVFDCDILAA